MASVQTKKITNRSSKFEHLFIYSTNAAKPHSCGSKDLNKSRIAPVSVTQHDEQEQQDYTSPF